MSSATLLGTSLDEVGPASFTRLVERLLWHIGFSEVSNVDGPGDAGADLVALHGADRWVFQAKWKASAAVDSNAVDELLRGLQAFDATSGAVVSNRRFTARALNRTEQLTRSTGVRLGLWGRTELGELNDDAASLDRFSTPDLRPYQVEAYQAARFDLERTGSAFLVLATGLGKTVIAGTVIDWFLSSRPGSQVLVLAHTRDLVEQLERAMWRHVPKDVPTQQLQGSEKPNELPGITIATIQSAISYLRLGYRPGLIFIDEAHHTGAGSQLAEALELCPEALRLGATATPWRGDEFDVSTYFGEPSYKVGIEEGLRLGYLVDVDYRLFVDNIDWEYVSTLSANRYSVADLNRMLFMPQRDERIRDELLDVWYRTRAPRAIVFCQTIEHAERMAKVLQGVPVWSRASTVHNGLARREQRTRLTKFRLGDIPMLIAVDVLNEGVDVPDVNIVCFARVTHSRRIFVQQLGRGLRLSEGKTAVTVMDFVSDLKRAKAALDLRRDITGASEDLVLPSSHSITFNDARAESLLTEWLMDAASLETAADEVYLNFPPFGGAH